MAAPPPPPPPQFEPLVAAVNVAFDGQMVTQADLAAAVAPLATQAAIAALDQRFDEMEDNFATLQAQLVAMNTQLGLIALPALAGAVTAIVRATAAARAQNAHDRRGVAYVPVPRDDGVLPPDWPAGFNRDALVEGPIGVVDALLEFYGLPHGPPAGLFVRRNALAHVLGTPRA